MVNNYPRCLPDSIPLLRPHRGRRRGREILGDRQLTRALLKQKKNDLRTSSDGGIVVSIKVMQKTINFVFICYQSLFSILIDCS